MDEKLIEELKAKFLENFPVEFTAIRPMKEQYSSLESYHKYCVDHGKNAFMFHRSKKADLPSLFFIPYQRSLVSVKGQAFIQMGKKAEVLHDPEPHSPFAEMVVGCSFKNDMSKQMAVEIVSGLLDDFNAPYYTFMTEAYQLKVKNDQEIPNKISKNPESQEILMIHTCNQIKTIGTHVSIVDNTLEKEEHHKDMGDDRRGRFSNLFKEIQAPVKTN